MPRPQPALRPFGHRKTAQPSHLPVRNCGISPAGGRWHRCTKPFTLMITMRRIGSSPFAFPEFRGATRQLVLVNLIAYFVLLVCGMVFRRDAAVVAGWLAFQPGAFLHGALWQPFTYSFIHFGIPETLFELLSLWFLAGF